MSILWLAAGFTADLLLGIYYSARMRGALFTLWILSLIIIAAAAAPLA